MVHVEEGYLEPPKGEDIKIGKNEKTNFQIYFIWR